MNWKRCGRAPGDMNSPAKEPEMPDWGRQPWAGFKMERTVLMFRTRTLLPGCMLTLKALLSQWQRGLSGVPSVPQGCLGSTLLARLFPIVVSRPGWKPGKSTAGQWPPEEGVEPLSDGLEPPCT